MFSIVLMCLPLLSLQFQDPEFGSLSGGRVVRIAVNPDYQGVSPFENCILAMWMLQHRY